MYFCYRKLKNYGIKWKMNCWKYRKKTKSQDGRDRLSNANKWNKYLSYRMRPIYVMENDLLYSKSSYLNVSS